MNAPEAAPELDAAGIWPGGDSRPLGTLSLTVDELQSRFGLQFACGTDDLDEYVFAVVKAPNGGQFCLLRYLRSPAAGTDVLIDARASRKDGLAYVKATIGVGPEQFEWVTDVAEQSGAAS